MLSVELSVLFSQLICDVRAVHADGVAAVPTAAILGYETIGVVRRVEVDSQIDIGHKAIRYRQSERGTIQCQAAAEIRCTTPPDIA